MKDVPAHERARRLARRLHALAGGPDLRRKAAARELARLDPTDATELIQDLLELSQEGWEPANCVLSSFVAALGIEASAIPYAGALRRLASLQDLSAVAALFPESAPRAKLDPNEAARRDAKLFNDTLGHLKTKARLTRNPDELAKVAMVSEPSVIRNALINPRLTEALVVRIAARRPARPEPLVEIWKCTKWSSLHAVRRALVFNPYLPPEVGAKIVPLLNTTDLAELANDRSVHRWLREQAVLLLKGAKNPRPEPLLPGNLTRH
jgi:hypothetical protein